MSLKLYKFVSNGSSFLITAEKELVTIIRDIMFMEIEFPKLNGYPVECVADLTFTPGTHFQKDEWNHSEYVKLLLEVKIPKVEGPGDGVIRKVIVSLSVGEDDHDCYHNIRILFSNGYIEKRGYNSDHEIYSKYSPYLSCNDEMMKHLKNGHDTWKTETGIDDEYGLFD